MSLSDVAAVGSLINGFAVLLSLIYLSIQIRQNTKHYGALIMQGRTARVLELSRWAADPSMAKLNLDAASGRKDLDEVELAQFMSYCNARFFNGEDTYIQHRSGLLNQAAFHSWQMTIRRFMRAPGFRVAWKLNRTTFDSDFVAFMDDIGAEAASQAIPQGLEVWKAMLATEVSVQAGIANH